MRSRLDRESKRHRVFHRRLARLIAKYDNGYESSVMAFDSPDGKRFYQVRIEATDNPKEEDWILIAEGWRNDECE